MNKLHIGFTKKVDLPKRGFLFIDDTVPHLSKARVRVFDPSKHSFNPLKGMDYRKAAGFVAAIRAIFPAGENTLTKEDSEYILMEALLSNPKSLETLIEPSKDPMQEKARKMIGRLLLSPVLRRVLCSPTNFTFNPNSVNLAKINRAELGEFDALVLGLLIIEQFKGQIVIPNFGFYGRDGHSGLIREDRLIAGINFLDELPEKLQHSVLSIKEKRPSGTTFEDAETLANYECRFPRGTDGYNTYIEGAMK